ncbi:MAG: shikimate kinase [Desulfurococcales archaeon]|nr:shikimate kinase [Desulfurococcales archaeon]
MALGVGEATGAVSVLNAIPTMIGGAVGIELRVRAQAWVGEHVKSLEGYSIVYGRKRSIEARILKAVASSVGEIVGQEPRFRVVVESEVPVASGLKSSSSLVVSMIRALLDAMGFGGSCEEAALAGVKASKMARITVTGAYDDHLAVACSGVFITDNRYLKVLRVYEPEKYHVAIWLPNHAYEASTRDPSVFRKYARPYAIAAELALKGDWLKAMALNGVLTSLVTGVGLEAVERALLSEHVIAAGVSGKGPAVFAVTRDPGIIQEIWGDLGGVTIVTALKNGGSHGSSRYA